MPRALKGPGGGHSPVILSRAGLNIGPPAQDRGRGVHADSPFSARGRPTARRAMGTVLIASAIAAAGCGSNAVNSAAEQGAQAICLSASAHINDPRAKHAADNA